MASKSNSLGKGLTALFGAETMEKSEGESGDLLLLDLLKIEPNVNQPRKQFEENGMNELCENVKLHGVITPIVVRRMEGGGYQIIAGERRWRAARMAGIEKIPARVITADEQTTMELALIENLQRQDLNAVEEAQGFQILMDRFSLSQDAVSQRVGKSRSAVANTLRLLGLNKEILAMIEKGDLTSGHGRGILSVTDSEKHGEFAKMIVENSLSVRQTEALAKKLNKEPKEKPLRDDSLDIYIGDLATRLENTLGRRIKINHTKNKGTIELEYYNDEDLEKLVEALDALNI